MTKASTEKLRTEYVQFPSETDTENVPARVIELSARVEGCEPMELPVFHDAIDADALDRIVTDASEDRYLNVQFEYNDAVVSVGSDGRISILPLDD